MSLLMLEETTRVRLDGAEPETQTGAKRAALALKMLEAGDRDLFLETDDLPFQPNAIAVLDGEGETIGYLPPATANEIREIVLAIEEDPDEEARATLISADDGEVWIEIDPDDFPEYEKATEPPPAPRKEEKKRNASGYALIAIIAFYLAYRLLTKSGG
jgi:hypothetical protein